MPHRKCLHAIAAALTVLVLSSGSASSQSAGRAGEVSEIMQTGFQFDAGRTALLDHGDPVNRNARLETDSIGEMAVDLDDGTNLVLLPNSNIKIDRFVYDPDQSGGQAVISLARGALRMISGNMPSDRYRLNTPSATIGIRGTDFTTEVIEGTGLLVRVDEGAVVILPNETTQSFTVTAGQVSLCVETGCRSLGTDASLVRTARLGPPMPIGQAGERRARAGQAKEGRARLGQVGASASQLAAVTGATGALRAEAQCPPYRIPDAAYYRVALDPAAWPMVVEGIVFYRHEPEGLSATLFCPSATEYTANETGFTVLGQAASGERKILYFVNTMPGRDMFQPTYDRRARQRQDASAYATYIAGILQDQRGGRIVKTEAQLRRDTAGGFVLQQRVEAQVSNGEYLATGMTLFRPVSDMRTGLFAIPAVITPRVSATARTAMKIGAPMFRQLAKDGG